MRGISIRVDRLTHSIEDARTGERHETEVLRVMPEQVGQIKKSHFGFDWAYELAQPGREVYKLVRVDAPRVVQGLVSLEDRGNPMFVHLIENARFNQHRSKKYVGVAGNLFAFACKQSFAKGYGGFVVFDSKTKLVDHYIRSLGAKQLSGTRLFLDTMVANLLVNRYFREENEKYEDRF
jgi:hypothetical protein